MKDRIYSYEPLWGEWYVDSLIGEGSFGRVYKVKKTELGEDFYAAVKMISIPRGETELKQAYANGMDKDTAKDYFQPVVTSLHKEIRLMAGLKGITNIVSIEDHKVIERSDSVGWDILFRMELLNNFNEFVNTAKMPRDKILKCGIDIASALEICHSNNVIHRDIKPDNIFVSPHGDFKLGDFGIARQIEKTSSDLSQIGTINYMAPEVRNGSAYNGTVDIYSLGLVLYRLFNNNRTPFMPPWPERITLEDQEKANAKRFAGEPLPPPAHADDSVASIILKACAFNPRDRYQNPSELKTDLMAALRGEKTVKGTGNDQTMPVPPPPPKPPKRTFNWKYAAAIAAMVVILLGFAGAATMVFSKPALEDIGLPESVTLSDSNPLQLSLAVIPEKASTKGISWSSDAPEIVSVDSKGRITGHKSGTATISATTKDGDLTATCQVIVDIDEPSGTELALNKEELFLIPGASEELQVESEEENLKLIWTSSNPAVATVKDGVVTAVAKGTATITVATEDGDNQATCTVTVSETTNPVTGVSLNKTSISLEAGKSDTLSATIAPANASNKNVTWSSSDTQVATVSNSGKVNALRPGTAIITVTTADGGKTATCTVTVTPGTVAVTGVSLNKTSLNLEAGKTDTLNPIIAPANASNKNVNWSSSNTSVATVNSNGVVTAHGPGTARITVTSVDGGKTATCTVTVTMPVAGVKLNKSSTNLNQGATETLTATVEPTNANNKNVTWSSSNTSVVTVNNIGVVTGVSAGNISLNKTATTINRGATETITVNGSATANITVTTQDGGHTAVCQVTVRPVVTWSSSNTSVATVNATGVITAVNGGTATITATTSDNKTATITVTVVVPDTGVTLNKSSMSLFATETERLTATVQPSDATNKNVTWQSSNTNVATVDSSGLVRAVGAGSATITVRTASGKTATCAVNVTALTRAIHLGSGKYGDFGTQLNNFYSAGTRTTSYSFEFITGSTVPANGTLFKYYNASNDGMRIYFDTSKRVTIHFRYSGVSNTRTCVNTVLQPNRRYTVTVAVTHNPSGANTLTVTINGVNQVVDSSGVSFTLNSGIKYLGSPSSSEASNVYITKINISGTPNGASTTLRTFSFDVATGTIGQTTRTSDGVTLTLRNVSVQDYKLSPQ